MICVYLTFIDKITLHIDIDEKVLQDADQAYIA